MNLYTFLAYNGSTYNYLVLERVLTVAITAEKSDLQSANASERMETEKPLWALISSDYKELETTKEKLKYLEKELTLSENGLFTRSLIAIL